MPTRYREDDASGRWAALALAVVVAVGLAVSASASASVIRGVATNEIRLIPGAVSYSTGAGVEIAVPGMSPRTLPGTAAFSDFELSASRALYSGASDQDNISAATGYPSENTVVADGVSGGAVSPLESCSYSVLVANQGGDEIPAYLPPPSIALDGAVEAYVSTCPPRGESVIVRDATTQAPATSIAVAGPSEQRLQPRPGGGWLVSQGGPRALALAGPYVALIDRGAVLVYNWTTGAQVLSAALAGAQALALTADGGLAVLVQHGSGALGAKCARSVVTFSLAAPTPRALRGCPVGWSLTIAGNRVAFVARVHKVPALVSQTLAGTDTKTVVELPDFFNWANPLYGDDLAWGGTRAAYPLFRCDPRRGGLALDTLVNGSSTTRVQTNCRLTVPRQSLTIRNHRMTVSFSCRDGCEAKAVDVGVAGSRWLSFGAGQHKLSFALPARVVRRLAHERSPRLKLEIDVMEPRSSSATTGNLARTITAPVSSRLSHF
ncbi:MAG: hypothetical protein ACYC91_17180 [Solirubrobacteraceae bacterium]